MSVSRDRMSRALSLRSSEMATPPRDSLLQKVPALALALSLTTSDASLIAPCPQLVLRPVLPNLKPSSMLPWPSTKTKLRWNFEITHLPQRSMHAIPPNQSLPYSKNKPKHLTSSETAITNYSSGFSPSSPACMRSLPILPLTPVSVL